ncbi:MAG: ferrochelatase [Deltaproteobacteria bacterium]|jgi:ferrochelatase|nr:ferrochelatase [Deltaproteobacteria bacterium]
MKFGILLVNLGTPDQPTPKAVGRYLRQFLMDPFVIDIPTALRWLLVNVAIVPRRKYKSAEAYQTVWTPEGSPLAIHLRNLVFELQKVRPDARVAGAMRYGNPSIEATLTDLKSSGITDLLVIPLYPQYAESSTRSSIEEVSHALARIAWSPALHVVRSFFDDQSHAEAWADLIELELNHEASDSSFKSEKHLLLSYHGLPERHLKKSDPSGSHCLDGGQATRQESELRTYSCCEKAISTGCLTLATCYRAQCLRTSQMIIEELKSRGINLKRDEWTMAFQSRLGRTPWIKPYTDDVIPMLAKRNVSLIVATPSFVADCLETIEEIGDRAKHDFLQAGGKDFRRVPCLNTSPTWVSSLKKLTEKSVSSLS